jgi:hypothetical protein
VLEATGFADIVNRFPIFSVPLQWFSKDFEEYKLRVTNLIRTGLILQNVCVDFNDVWSHEVNLYKEDAPMPAEPAEVEELTGSEVREALYRYINRRVTMDVATGKLMPRLAV